MINKIMNIFSKDKRISNLLLVLGLLIIIAISADSLFAPKLKETSSSNVVASEDIKIEEKLANIIKAIDGVREAEVLVTYSTSEKVLPVYDLKEDIDVEKYNEKETSKTTTEKNVAYETKNGEKVAIIESKETALAAGAVVVVSGKIDTNTRNYIKDAVSVATGVPLHKIQVFVNE